MSGGREFEIIARIFAPLANETGALELKDDAAILTVTDGHELVVTCDALVEGVLESGGDLDTQAAGIAHRELADAIEDRVQRLPLQQLHADPPWPHCPRCRTVSWRPGICVPRCQGTREP